MSNDLLKTKQEYAKSKKIKPCTNTSCCNGQCNCGPSCTCQVTERDVMVAAQLGVDPCQEYLKEEHVMDDGLDAKRSSLKIKL